MVKFFLLFSALIVIYASIATGEYSHSTTDKKQSLSTTYSSKQKIHVSSLQELRVTLTSVQPGANIVVAPGIYKRGIHLKNVHGLPEMPIIIEGEKIENPPIFTGLGEGLKLSSCSYLKFANIIFRGFPTNGINIDDSGKGLPSHHIVLENIAIQDIGPRGNHDALKMSGVENFIVRHCRFAGWGGSGIDLVGCRDGLIEKCSFMGKEGFRTANAIQVKGGSCHILIQGSVFHNAGDRAVSVGGSTGLKYFRPAPNGYEARWVTVAGNTFVGGEAQIAWVTAQESHVHHNLFYYPEKWVGRILQETKSSRFEPCGWGLFENNLVVVDDRVKVFFNVGKGTHPSSFVFRKNAWYNPGRKIKPTLPMREKGGVYNIDPKIEVGDSWLPVVRSDVAQLRDIGPRAYSPWVSPGDFARINPPLFLVPENSALPFAWKIAFVGGLGGLLLVLIVWRSRFLKSRKNG